MSSMVSQGIITSGQCVPTQMGGMRLSTRQTATTHKASRTERPNHLGANLKCDKIASNVLVKICENCVISYSQGVGKCTL